MRSWDDYKKTMIVEHEIFDLARGGNSQALKEVINESNINLKNSKGYSPLMLAAYNGHFEASKLLLDHLADPNSCDHTGNSILMGTAFKGDLEIVKLLLERGADPSIKNSKNQTALNFAQMFGRSDVANYLNPKTKFSISDQILSWLNFIIPKKRSLS